MLTTRQFVTLIFFCTHLMTTHSQTKCPTKCKCFSQKGTRTVSCRSVGLKKVPEGIPADTQHLDLAYNSIQQLPDGIFDQVPNITILEVQNNKLSYIGNDIIQKLTFLTTLDVSANNLDKDKLEQSVFCALPSTAITVLKVQGMSPPLELTLNASRCLRETNITDLDISGNIGICDLPGPAFSGMQKLTSVKLKKAKCIQFHPSLFNGTMLQNLDLQNNWIVEFPSFLQDGIPILPYLQSLQLTDNRISEISSKLLVGLDNLEYLYLTNNALIEVPAYAFINLKRLKNVNLENNKIWALREYAFSSKSLENIVLSRNPLTIRDDRVFKNSTNLKVITLVQGEFYNYYIFENLFQNINTLKILRISSMRRIAYIPTRTFYGLPLLETLVLSNNGIQYVTHKIFKDLKILKELDLSGNNIRNFNESSFPRNWTLSKVTLQGNPFECTCDLLWFVDWLRTAPAPGQLSKYQCAFPTEYKGKFIGNVSLTDKKCLAKGLSKGIRISMSLSFSIVLWTVLLSAVYRCRWYLKYLLYRLTKHKQLRFPETDSVRYDAFVSYNCQDLQWVKHTLLPELERRSDPTFRLCVSDRDWLAGHDQVDCIYKSIEESHKILLIITNAFAASQWNQMQLTMAQHQLFEENQDRLVLAVMEDIDPINLSPRLALELNRRGQIHWTDEDQIGQRLFWDKLKTSIRTPNTRISWTLPSLFGCCKM